ncbi:zinc finger Y-chromosomal protein 2 [Copidosoma floridanum]|uniref:zinc finger Y-chromosomal protein 2 n=1 Tax=Copidosoma floridanum TaxID=29053 RepID=UPI0006C99809|nr:zinc finger Y-chromosomal protein 2 [Copidosoma floridanum]
MEPSEPRDFSEMREEDFVAENYIFMKEELIITDPANQLDCVQTNILSNLQNVKNDESALDITPMDVISTKLEEGTNGSEFFQEEDNDTKNDDGDDIVIISEEKISESTPKPKKSVIIPEIVKQMMIIKSEMRKGKRVPSNIVFVKKCRLCQKIQKESRSQTMIKCQDCDSRCFLFQCLLCFKRYTTVTEVFTHINKKHADKVQRKCTENYQQQSPKGIRVTSNKYLDTNEKFHFTQAQKSVNISSSVNNAGTVEPTKEKEDKEHDPEGLMSCSNPPVEILLKEDIPLKQTEIDIREEIQLFRCTQCDYSTSFKRYYQEHVRRRHLTIDPNNYTTCPDCKKQFRLLKDLKSHLSHCGKEPYLKCKFCEYKTNRTGTLKVHMQSHLVKEKAVKLVNALVDSGQSNGSGIKNADLEQSLDQFSSSVSDALSTSMSEQEMVENQMKNSMQAYCPKCNKRVRSLKKKKCSKCNNLLVYRCKVCSCTHANLSELHQHVMRIHFAHREKPCPKCRKMVVELRTHLKICGVKPSYSCTQCSFKTKHHYSYVAHMRHKHQTDRKDFYKCERCSKEFAVLRYLHRHQKHYCDTQPKYGCAHCSLRTRSKGNLVRHISLLHMETMSDVKFICKKCQTEYRNLYMYDIHIKHCNKKDVNA